MNYLLKKLFLGVKHSEQ